MAWHLSLLVLSPFPLLESEDHVQRRYYELSVLGRQVLTAEIERVGAFIDHARAAMAEPG